MGKKKQVDIKETVKGLPGNPGVYKFFDRKGNIIYVGKAKNLKKRVSTYFQKGRVHDARIEMLKSEVDHIEVVNTSSEAEALICEAGLIKDHRPKFNMDLKDDKSYPFLKLTINEKFPRIFVTRRRLNDGARYYGPYVNSALLREALFFMKKIFKLRSCSRIHKKLCLEYHIDQCEAPCEGKISVSEYARIVDQIEKFLEGKKADLIVELQKEMFSSARGQDYERAMAVKKRIHALTSLQKLHDSARKPIFGELEKLRNSLELDSLPVTIECFDVSNTGGDIAVGSMVKFVAGQPIKAGYRKFKIRGVTGADDYSMIREIVRRRYTRILKDGSKFPDLILIDGGRGHLSAAKGELNKLGLDDLNIVSIAKEYNHIYTPSRKIPIRLSPGSSVLLLIQRIRDEAHRFAIAYHRKLRSREALVSNLRKIKGIGPEREKKLFEAAGSLNEITKLSKQELIALGIDKKTAGRVSEYFKRA